MKFLLEGAEICYPSYNYKGESPFEIGVRLKLDPKTSLWSGVEPEYEEKYIFEILKEISDVFNRFKYENNRWEKDYAVYFGYHLTSEPMTWDEAQENYIATVLGAPVSTYIYHSYSDLTGYLWTNINIEDQSGHDVYAEIKSMVEEKPVDEWPRKKLYLTMLFEIKPKEG